MTQWELFATNELGATGLEITRVAFGEWAIGGAGWEFGWAPQQDEQSIGAIHRALEDRTDWIDAAVADVFGHSAEILGRARQAVTPRPFVFTACSLLAGPGRTALDDPARHSIGREAQASFEQLGLEAVDLHQIHWPDPEADIAEGFSALVELKAEGLAREIEPGVPPIDEDEGIGVIVYSAIGSGLLTGTMTRAAIEGPPADDLPQHDVRFRTPQLRQHRVTPEHLATANRLLTAAARLGFTPGAVPVAWVLRHTARDEAIVGTRPSREPRV